MSKVADVTLGMQQMRTATQLTVGYLKIKHSGIASTLFDDIRRI